MITRRSFARHIGGIAAAGPFLGEGFLARRALAEIPRKSDIVWLDANENPEGPPRSSIDAITQGAAATARYHFDEFEAFSAAIAKSEEVKPDQVMFGVGSSEILNAAVGAFTSASRPLITAVPTFEVPVELTRSLGRNVIQVALTDKWGFPVKTLAEQAANAGGGLIYICNPNNPTASLTPKADIAWLASNLPPNTVLLLDEAYIHFARPADVESGMRYVQQDKNVLVTRTFSKIYGMAGARVGFGCARPQLIQAMMPFKDNIVPILGLRAATAALNEAPALIPKRRATMARIRGELCAWLRQKNFAYIDAHANFVMFDIRRDVREFGAAMLRKGVAVGRPFPPMNTMLRITLGTDQEMAKFREVFGQVYSG